MAANNCHEYLRMQIQTSSREKLVLMLFDGVLRFCEQAQEALTRKDFAASHQCLLRCQDIILELAYGLDREKGGEIAANLARLYAWCLHCLVQANMTREATRVEEVKKVFRHLREGWDGAMKKLRQSTASERTSSPPAPAADKNAAAALAKSGSRTGSAAPAAAPPQPRLSVRG